MKIHFLESSKLCSVAKNVVWRSYSRFLQKINACKFLEKERENSREAKLFMNIKQPKYETLIFMRQSITTNHADRHNDSSLRRDIVEDGRVQTVSVVKSSTKQQYALGRCGLIHPNRTYSNRSIIKVRRHHNNIRFSSLRHFQCHIHCDQNQPAV